MSGLSLPSVSAEITGNADGLASSLDKAANDTKVKCGQMADTVDSFTKRINRSFGAGAIAGGFLRGLGAGTAFQLVEHLSEKISDHWKKAADAAKELEKAVEHMAAINAEEGLKRLNLAQQAASLEMQVAKLQKEKKPLDYPYNPIRTNNGEYDPILNPLRNQLDPQAVRSRTPEQQTRYAELGVEITKLASNLADVNRKIKDESKTAFADFIKDANVDLAKTKEKKKRDDAKEQRFEDRENKPGDPLSDRFTKMGLLSGAGLNGAGITNIPEKQLTVLQQIKDAILRGRSQFVRGGDLLPAGTSGNLI